MEPLMTVARWFAGAVGLSLFLYVMLSYEDEERRAANWITAAWSVLYEFDKGVSVRLRKFLQAILRGADNIYSLPYGNRLISTQGLVTSASFSTALALYISEWHGREVVWVPILFIIVLSPFIRRRSLSYTISAFGIATFALILLINIKETYTHTWRISGALMDIGTPLALAVIDFLAIAAMRKLFRLAAYTSSLIATILAIAAAVLCGLAITVCLANMAIYAQGQLGLIFSLDGHSTLLTTLVVFTIFIAVQSLVFLFAILMVGFGRSIIAVAPRALYSLIKLKIVENRKTTAGIGVALIGLAMPQASTAFETVVKLLFS